MRLIDRYIYAVEKYLPEDYREDVGNELRANIEDMLPENPSEKDEYEVLEKLGSPWRLANEYHPKKRYLIGPGFYDRYLSVLKTVIGICIIVALGIGIISWGMEVSTDGFTPDDWIQLFVQLFAAVFEGALQGALWVTIVFVILERSGVEPDQVGFSKKQWSPEDLAEPTDAKGKISRGESAFSIFFTVLITSLFYFKPEIMSLYLKNENGTIDRITFFNIEVLHNYLTVILLLAIVQIGIYAWKLLSGYWNLPLAIANTINNIAITILILSMVNHSALFNPKFSQTINHYINQSPEELSTWFNVSKWTFIGVFIAIILWDSFTAIAHSVKRK